MQGDGDHDGSWPIKLFISLRNHPVCYTFSHFLTPSLYTITRLDMSMDWNNKLTEANWLKQISISISCSLRYSFATPSTMKPTQWTCPSGSINQIPGEATVCGDIRITPFYDILQVRLLWIHTVLHVLFLRCCQGMQLSSSRQSTVTRFCFVSMQWHVLFWQVKNKLEEYVADINRNIGSLMSVGPCSKYELPDEGLQVKRLWRVMSCPVIPEKYDVHT